MLSLKEDHDNSLLQRIHRYINIALATLAVFMLMMTVSLTVYSRVGSLVVEGILAVFAFLVIAVSLILAVLIVVYEILVRKVDNN